MSRIDDAIICTKLGEKIQWGWISTAGDIKYSINKLHLKRADGKRLTRYAVLINGKWDTSKDYSLKDAREYVRIETELHVWGVTYDEMKELCRTAPNLSLYSRRIGDVMDDVEFLLLYDGKPVGNNYMTIEKIRENIRKEGGRA